MSDAFGFSPVKIATRRSPLALWQANHVKKQLINKYPNMLINLVLMTTTGDINLAGSLANLGGKGLFVKELEIALLNKQADIAVHSMKDMTIQLPDNLTLAAFMPREDARDALLSRNYLSLDDLPPNAIVGTSSLRRKAQLLAIRPDLIIKSLRGNVNTRIDKLQQGEYDAIILAAAGLIRLGLEKEIKQLLPVELMLPAVGQAIIGLETRKDDERFELIQSLGCTDSASCITAERSMNLVLGGSCTAPIAGFATIQNQKLHLRGRVLSQDGKKMIEASGESLLIDAAALGVEVAQTLLKQGAEKILQEAK
ncbi:MAG: hydroxymethylbilane synthase [Legionellales bacterium]|nr:hydroxymethylbilane synthase [Legionellales bacterium]